MRPLRLLPRRASSTVSQDLEADHRSGEQHHHDGPKT
jgi:hypothetical protein